MGSDGRRIGQPDPRIERWLAIDRPWRAELSALRAILLDEGLDEALKWRAPCYTAHGANVAILSGLSDAAALSFFKGILIGEGHGLLTAPGPNSRSARYAKFTSLEQVATSDAAIRSCIRQAVDNERRGLTVEMRADDIDLPDELAEALAAQPELAAAFEALTPGRQRGYALQIGGAKKAETRRARVEKWAPRILAGKGLHDR
ncbi:MAG: YdeI/OmpD-associated family protein [Pseudomonadota bacterium]